MKCTRELSCRLVAVLQKLWTEGRMLPQNNFRLPARWVPGPLLLPLHPCPLTQLGLHQTPGLRHHLRSTQSCASLGKLVSHFIKGVANMGLDPAQHHWSPLSPPAPSGPQGPQSRPGVRVNGDRVVPGQCQQEESKSSKSKKLSLEDRRLTPRLLLREALTSSPQTSAYPKPVLSSSSLEPSV